MLIMLISMLFIAFSLQFFMLNFQIQGLNREMLNTPIQLLAKCIIVKEEVVYFDRDLLIENMDDYFDGVIPRYTHNYEVSYYFYNLEDHSYCTPNYCEGVEITIDCSLTSNYDFTRTMYYETREGIYG